MLHPDDRGSVSPGYTENPDVAAKGSSDTYGHGGFKEVRVKDGTRLFNLDADATARSPITDKVRALVKNKIGNNAYSEVMSRITHDGYIDDVSFKELFSAISESEMHGEVKTGSVDSVVKMLEGDGYHGLKFWQSHEPGGNIGYDVIHPFNDNSVDVTNAHTYAPEMVMRMEPPTSPETKLENRVEYSPSDKAAFDNVVQESATLPTDPEQLSISLDKAVVVSKKQLSVENARIAKEIKDMKATAKSSIEQHNSEVASRMAKSVDDLANKQLEEAQKKYGKNKQSIQDHEQLVLCLLGGG
jgi:hypothetical protein